MALAGKIAVVTGAGTGIGRAVSVALAKEGSVLALAGRRREGLDKTAEAIREAGSSALVHPTDVGDPDSVSALFDAVAGKFGRVDILFNNAGCGTPPVPIDELTYEQWRRCLDTNLSGSFLCAQRAFGAMKRQDPIGGRIINNGSISAEVPRPFSAPYTSTKHAITGLTKAIALDGRPHRIACGQIDIGNALTEMAAPMVNGILQPDGSVRPEPTMDVQHVADAVVHMAKLPLESNVLRMTIMATNMPFVGRG